MTSAPTPLPLVLAISRLGRAVAERIAAHLGTAVEDGHGALATAFSAQRPVIAVGALGIWIRLLAPLLVDKQRDPAIVVVDDTARFVVPLIGAHHGGNALARRLAALLDAVAVITTATDALGVPSPETLAEDHGWRVDATRDALLRIAAALVNNDPLTVFQDTGDDTAWRATLPSGARMVAALPDLAATDTPALLVTDRLIPGMRDARDRVVALRPPTLIAGIGASRGAPAEEIETLLDAALREAECSALSLAGIATADLKRDEPGIVALAARLGIAVTCYPAEALASVPVPTPSAVVAGHVGTPSVAEAAALLAARTSTLLLPKRVSPHATIAIARITPPRLP